MKILVAGFQHETNTFAPTVASYESFVRGEDFPALARGAAVLDLLNVNIPISGFIEHVREHGHEVIPVIWAGAGASAHVTTDAYERIAGEILEAVKTERYDAIYLDLHGAMVAQHVDDGEGELLARVRAVVGAEMKIAVSLDSHANVTSQMLSLADAIVAYRTYPHVDMAETGRRAARLLLDIAGKQTAAHRVARRLPFLIPVNSMSTMMQPARGIYDLLEELEASNVLSLSFAPGFPASDFEECGPVVWGYGFDAARIEQAVDQLFARIAGPEAQWAVTFEEADAAVQKAIELTRTVTGPVILADTQDNPGVGGDSNTTGLLRALLKAGAQGVAVGLIFDPAAAAQAHRAGVGAQIELALGGCPQVPGDEPLQGRFIVEALSDGKLVYGGPMMNGKQADLGPTARLRIDGVQIVVSSAKAQLLDRNMYRVAGIEPADMKILVNKSSVHFRADFAAIAGAIIVARSPGPFIADPSQLPWKHLRSGMRTRPCGPAFRPDVGATSGIRRRVVAAAPLLMRAVLSVVPVAFALSAATATWAADGFPSKPITMIAAFPPGGPADVLARAMQPTMSKLLGQPFIVENLPGAGGALAVQRMLSLPADGHTLMMGSPNEAILAPLSNVSAKYKAEDMALIAPVSSHPLVVMTRPDLPYTSLEQLIAASRKPGSDGLTFGSPGHGSMYHIVSEYLAQASGAKLVHVPYRGATPMLTDLAGQQIDLTILPNLGASIQMIETQKIKAIGVMDSQRMRTLPGVPAITEGSDQHKSDYLYSIWLGVMAKSGIPADRLKLLLEASQQAIQSPEMVRALALSGAEPMKPQSLAASGQFYASETEKFARMAKSIKLSPQ